MGGIERQVHDLARRQALAGHDVEIVTSVAAGPGLGDTLRVHRPGSGRLRPGAINYLSATSGHQQVLRGGYDLVHVHASTFSPLAYLAAGAASAHGLPTVITAHSLWSYAAPIFRVADIALGWRDWPMTWSAVSTVAARPLRRMLGEATQVELLPNGDDPQAWRVPIGDRTAGRVVIVSVMRLAQRKRPRQFLEILRRVRDLVPKAIELEAVIIGDGPLRGSLQRQISRHRMHGWVQMVGQRDAEGIREIYRDADLYVAPATLESFGIAALEARCAGLPVIAHAQTGIADFITHGREGLLAFGDREMAALIARLATAPDQLERIRTHNVATTPPVSWEAVSQRCDLLYATAQARAGIRPVRARRITAG
jgi:glycosyltransferase involved in cell wall biosynthesis